MDIIFVFETKVSGSNPDGTAKNLYMDHYKKMFWVSSYPRSGNTWLRLILCGLFFTKDGNVENFDILKKIRKLDLLNNFEFCSLLTEAHHQMKAIFLRYFFC